MPLSSFHRRQFLACSSWGLVLPPTLLFDLGLTRELLAGGDSWEMLAEQGHLFQHWTPEEDDPWKWYRLERFVDGTWDTAGISLPTHRETGEVFEPDEGYLPANQIPQYVIEGTIPPRDPAMVAHMMRSQYDPEQDADRQPDPEIRSRDGKPPSDWLLSLWADELRAWLETSEMPQAGVRGMTVWVHLVRDHGFDPRRIEGLSEAEFHRLHSAAHYGY